MAEQTINMLQRAMPDILAQKGTMSRSTQGSFQAPAQVCRKPLPLTDLRPRGDATKGVEGSSAWTAPVT